MQTTHRSRKDGIRRACRSKLATQALLPIHSELRHSPGANRTQRFTRASEASLQQTVATPTDNAARPMRAGLAAFGHLSPAVVHPSAALAFVPRRPSTYGRNIMRVESPRRRSRGRGSDAQTLRKAPSRQWLGTGTYANDSLFIRAVFYFHITFTGIALLIGRFSFRSGSVLVPSTCTVGSAASTA